MKTALFIFAAVSLTGCTVSWTVGADGSETFHASLAPIPVTADTDK